MSKLLLTPSNRGYTQQTGIVNKQVTWDVLVRLEPRLIDLYKEAQSVKATNADFCANAIWYGYHNYRGRGIKPRLESLVGWGRRLRDRELMKQYDAGVAAVEEKAGEWGIICLGDFPPLPPVIGCNGPGILCTSEAYDKAYRTLYELLPACRRCGCL